MGCVFCYFCNGKQHNLLIIAMDNILKVIVAMMVMMVVAAGCNKPEDPNQGNHENQGNDTIVVPVGDTTDLSYVDLRLPSGTLWAVCNVGADTPEGYGDYYAWGETQPKEVYDWNSYRYGTFTFESYVLYKYCTSKNYGLDGFVDSLTVLEPDDDVVRACWGEDWRMPTIDEWEELFQNTTCVWTALNGVDGWLFTALNGNSLFLPAAGYWWDSEYNGAGLGVYWSCSLNKEFPNRAWGFHFNPYSCHLCGSSDRNRGQTVRAVRSRQ